MVIVYLHGFLSGPQAIKANLLRSYLRANAQQRIQDLTSADEKLNFKLGPEGRILLHDIDLFVPPYGDVPEQGYNFLVDFFENLNHQYDASQICVIGSSMGGFFATLMQVLYGYKIALINPCVHPQNLFTSLLGTHYNQATNTHFEFKAEMLDYLVQLDAKLDHFEANKTLVLLQKGDTTLDYRLAQNLFNSATIDISEHGSHSFDGFENKISTILKFFAQS